MDLEGIFAEVFAVRQRTVQDSLRLREIPSWDSMSHMLLIARLEERFSIEFTGDEIADFRTVGDIRNAINQHGGR
jgi:acyl carrier protein